MKALESWTLAYLLNSIWQVPLVFAAAWTAARAVRRSSVAIEHRIWVSALALEVFLPACSVRLAELFRAAWQLLQRIWGVSAARGEIRVTVGSGTVVEHGLLRLPAFLLITIAILYGCSVAYFAGRLVWGIWKTAAMRRRAERLVLTEAASRSWERCSRFFGIHDATALSGDVPGPTTIGVLRRVFLLPAGWLANLTEDDLDAAMAHEFAHMRRRDFAKNLVYELLSIPVAYHPLLWLTRARIAAGREMICDAMAAEAVAGREKYARSLLRLASLFSQQTPARTLHAIGIFDANIFERRVMNLTEKYVELRGMRRTATVAVCLLLGLGTCASALALRLEVSASVVQNENQSGAPAKVSASVMAGNILTRGANPVYPPDAKAAGTNGTVVLRAIIGKDGTVEHLDVVSGPEQFRSSALEAVRQWTYKPYLLNGNPQEVETTVTVNYLLKR